MKHRTRQNLETALHSEAFDYAEYLRFAAHARMEGHKEAAGLFQQAADVSRTHNFAREAEMAGLVARDSDNLRLALEKKKAAINDYEQYAREAAEDGDLAAATLFKKIRANHVVQAQTLEKACWRAILTE